MSVGQRITQKRKELGLSQESLGEQLGVSRQAIYKWESDATLPEIEKLIALSRIFSVSVGWLLGVEDEPADAEQSDHSELNEAQLNMVREIVDGYLAARPAPEAPKRRRWPRVLGAIACIVLVAALVNLFNRLDNLNSQYGNLQASVGNIQHNVSSQLSSLTGRMEEILKSQNSLTADYTAEAISLDPTAGTATFSFRVVPRTYQKGLQAWIDVENQGERTTFGPYAAQGEVFSGEFVTALTDQITVYIVFELDGVRQTQLLDTFQNLHSSTFPDLWINAWPLIFSVDSKADTLEEDLDITLSAFTESGDNCTPEEAGIVSARIGLFADQTLAIWSTLGTRTVMVNGVQVREECFTLKSNGFPLDRAKTYCIAAILTDQYGREYVIQDCPIYYRDGEGWTNLTTYSSRPLSTEDWNY